MALRYLVVGKIDEPIHFVGAVRPHTPTCDACRRPQKDVPAAVQ